jgi:hypothetical protein
VLKRTETPEAFKLWVRRQFEDSDFNHDQVRHRKRIAYSVVRT